ncbi:rho GTPase-activating protein 32 isoform X3 [Ambystoma mexicanum]|uniref:rho GTPase-activating protein 32 isoform X3 n=1 Tax=Ambystoma mexicanum TaxID=8296 RepID=UPI0037E8EBF1
MSGVWLPPGSADQGLDPPFPALTPLPPEPPLQWECSMDGGWMAGAGAPLASSAHTTSLAGIMGRGPPPDAAPERIMKSSHHLEEDDFVPELQRNIHPRERPDWEETLCAMARGADFPELPVPGDLPLRSCGSTASMKVKHVKKLSFTKGHFPKMAECAHFHYENVDFGSIQLSLLEEQSEVTRNGCESRELVYLIQISCQGRSWIVKRSYEDFRVLDKHLHLCIYDRRFSQLAELPRSDSVKDSPEVVTQMLMAYLARLSAIAGNRINCGPALTWMEIDNKGNHLLVHEESSINVPAIAAAHVIKRYNAQAADELSFEVGDIVSVIDMPPKELTSWWRGKHGFQVGFFPSECVELINDKVPQSMTNSVPKPDLEMNSVLPTCACTADNHHCSQLSSVSKKHGKLITFLRTFMKSRPTKQKLKQRGILKERVFGCDLGEHLLNSGYDVPQVLRSCTEFIEKHGIVDGMYRLSGIASNIQKLRHEFDSEQIPDLTKDVYIQDIHCVGSLCKLYFRELPNPLLTYQLYEKFSDAVSVATDEERLVKIHDVIQQLPPPHYRTLEFLMRHLYHLATYCSITNMHTKNLAIVWAPNLLRSKQIESACFSGTAAFMEVRIQSVVVEFILNHVDVLFSPKLSAVIRDGPGHTSMSRPKSLLVSSPSTKLLTLEEAQARTQAQINSPVVADSKYIEVGDGPAALQGKFHTVIDFPSERKRPSGKLKKSPVGSWRAFFNLGKSSSSTSVSKRKLQRNPSEPTEMKAMALAGGRGDSGTLRSAKSEESLSSVHAVDGESKLFRPRRPRSSSDALSTSYNGELLENVNCYNSYDNLPQDSESDEGLIHVPVLMSPRSPEEVDLSPPEIGVANLDFDPMSFQCSPPHAEPEAPDSSTSQLDSAGSSSRDKPMNNRRDLEYGGQSHTPGSATSSEPVSPFQEKLTSPFFPLEMSPSEEKTSKPTSFAEKVAHAFSPKIGRKSTKSPPMNISEPIAISLPNRVSEMMGGSPGNISPPNWTKGCFSGDVVNMSPSQEYIAVFQRPNEMGANDVSSNERMDRNVSHVREVPGEAMDPLGLNIPTRTSPLEQSPCEVTAPEPQRQEPLPVNSATFIPPPPPPKNAARMLALALAESAQQVTTLSQLRPVNSHAANPNPPGLMSTIFVEEKPQAPPALETPATTESIYMTPTSEPVYGTANDGPSFAVTPSGAALVSISTSQLTLTNHQAAPALPPRPMELQPTAGPVPTGSALGSTLGSQVDEMVPSQAREGEMVKAAEEPPVEPGPADPVHGFYSDSTAAPRPANSTHAVPQAPTEKPREGYRAPPLYMRSESFPSQPTTYAFGPPVPPVRSMESRIATAVHAGHADAINASNYHSFLSSSMLPSSVEDALPPQPPKHSYYQPAYLTHCRSESMPDPSLPESFAQSKPISTHQSKSESTTPHYNYHSSKFDPYQIYGSRSETSTTNAPRYNTYMSQGKSAGVAHPKPRGRADYLTLGSPALRSTGYTEEDPPYPTIRRVQSLHAPPPPPPVRSVPISRTEVPPDDEPVYCSRSAYPFKPQQPFPPHSDYHVTQLQPYFENGRVHYRYSPYSSSSSSTYYSSDGTFYDLDPYSTVRLRQMNPYHSRDFASYTSRFPTKNPYRSSGLLPYPWGSIMGQLAGKEHSFVSRDMPPAPEAKHMYMSWDLEDMDKYRMQSIRRESRARQKVKGPVMSQYDNVAPGLHDDLSGLDIIHHRSRSDPGKMGLLTVVEGKDGRYPAKAATPDGNELYYSSYPEAGMDRVHYHGNYGNGQPEKPLLPQKSGTWSRKLHDPVCSPHEHRPHPHQDLSHRQPSELKNGPTYAMAPASHLDYRAQSLPDPPEPTTYHHLSGKYSSTTQDTLRQSHKEVRLSEERPDVICSRSRTTSSAAKPPSKDCYREEDPPMAPPPKPERSHSLRAHPQEPSERDCGPLYHYQTLHGKRQSTMTLVSQYDNLENYHAVPPPQRGGPGFSHAHSRTYATALGQGGFLAAELALQRAETEIHAE